jgi:DNA polymerase/3'-5' exonuclease PolX
MSTDFKQIIIDSLDVLRKRDIADKEVFSARAYAKVISQLKTHPAPITQYEDLASITGIGAKMEKKIKEILETGQLASAERAKQLYNIDALDAFQKIYGVGPTKASALVAAGYTSIKQLRDAVEGDTKLLNDKQLVGLKYYEDLLERIPREEMDEHRDNLIMLLPDEMEKTYEVDIVGSYRREAATSGDIDMLIRVPPNTPPKTIKNNLKTYVDLLHGFGYVEEILALGEHKCMAICRIHNGKARRLDILMTPDNEYAYALLYFTGSDRFNVAFRQHALDKGYTLNEHTLTPLLPNLSEPPYMKTENDIFKFLGLRYIEPSKRVDANQIIPVRQRPKVAPE